MKKEEHICKFERPIPKFQLRLWDPGVYATEELIFRISLFFKGEKRVKKIRQCHICEKYALECPYCHSVTTMDTLPIESTCSICHKKYGVRKY